MYIRSDDKGNITLISRFQNINCVQYTGVVPADFYQTIGYGKYNLVNGVITEIEGWVMPAPPPLPVIPAKQ